VAKKVFRKCADGSEPPSYVARVDSSEYWTESAMEAEMFDPSPELAWASTWFEVDAWDTLMAFENQLRDQARRVRRRMRECLPAGIKMPEDRTPM